MAGIIPIYTGYCGWLCNHLYRFLWLALYPSLQVTVPGCVTIYTDFGGLLCVHLYLNNILVFVASFSF